MPYKRKGEEDKSKEEDSSLNKRPKYLHRFQMPKSYKK
jgi:hypothetical protein